MEVRALKRTKSFSILLRPKHRWQESRHPLLILASWQCRLRAPWRGDELWEKFAGSLLGPIWRLPARLRGYVQPHQRGERWREQLPTEELHLGGQSTR